MVLRADIVSVHALYIKKESLSISMLRLGEAFILFRPPRTLLGFESRVQILLSTRPTKLSHDRFSYAEFNHAQLNHPHPAVSTVLVSQEPWNPCMKQ